MSTVSEVVKDSLKLANNTEPLNASSDKEKESEEFTKKLNNGVPASDKLKDSELATLKTTELAKTSESVKDSLVETA